MKTLIDSPTRAMRLEEAYRKISQGDDDTDSTETLPPDTRTKRTTKNTDKKQSIIDLTTVSSEEEIPKVAVKQEVDDDGTVARVKKDKGKNVVAKSYRQGDGKVTGKAGATETVLGAVANHLSAEAQEKREISRMNLLRESRFQDRQDRVLDEKEREIDDLKRENNTLRERAAAAETMLNLASHCGFNPLAYQSGPTPGPSVYRPAVNVTSAQPFAFDPDQYAVYDDSEPNDGAGPEPMIAEHGQGGAGAEGLSDSEE